jgi:sarcosine oxidase/L-pipecolate oxidase
MEENLAPDLAHAWRWRPGGDALKSKRAAPAQDLADLPGWKGEQGQVDEVQDTSPGLSSKAHL